MPDPVLTTFPGQSVDDVLREQTARKLQPVIPTSDVINDSGDTDWILAPTQRIRLKKMFIQAKATVTGAVIVTVKFSGGLVVRQFSLEASQPFSDTGPWEAPTKGEKLIVNLDTAGQDIIVNTDHVLFL